MTREMIASLRDVIPELILLGGGVAILLFALLAPRRAQVGAALLALGTSVAAGVATVTMLGSAQGQTFFDTYSTDDVAVWAKLIILAATIAVIALSIPWFTRDPRHGEYYTLLLFSSLGAALLAGATDLMEIVMAIVLSSATSYVLIAYHRRSKLASEAAIKYFLIAALMSSAMLLGVALLFGLAGTTTLSGLQERLPDSAAALVAGTALIVAALAFKMGSVPAHAWMPDVAQGAPAPVAAFVTTVPKVGGLVALARLVSILPDTIGWRPLVALLAAATMTLGNLAALWQDDVRRLLGWSAVSQTGYALMALAALGRSDLAIPSLVYFLLAYVLANIAAFGVVVELRGRTDRVSYAGLARAHPLLAISLVIAFLSLIGIPPLVGFGAKLALFTAAIEANYEWLAVVAAINTVVSIFYYARVMAPAYFEDVPAPVPVLGRWAAAATYALASAVIAAGVVAEPMLDALRAALLVPG
ncbi:MAG: NADH-quinone oxidoreductase subunit N [Actinomycetota bacterium]|nr:NADH-quinone oxidoreductase subunit N [Actinomycetota bacterium]